MVSIHSDISAKAVVLRDLIGYQDKSVVSRSIVDRTSGNVTLFAFDKGQGLSEHTAPFDKRKQIEHNENTNQEYNDVLNPGIFVIAYLF